jgi:hypothetical protein
MKVYLAGRYEDIAFLRDIAFLMMAAGHTVTSRWLAGEIGFGHLPETQRSEIANEDIEDILACDTFVLYSHMRPPLPTRQAHTFELGFAAGLNRTAHARRKLYLVGERTENLFHYIDELQHMANWQAFLDLHGCRGRIIAKPEPFLFKE